MQYRNGDSILENYVAKTKDTTRINSGQKNYLSELKAIWQHCDESIKVEFQKEFKDIVLLLDVQVDRDLIRAMNQYWHLAYNCFKFGEVDVTCTLEEYEALIHCPSVAMDNVHMRPYNFLTFRKMLKVIRGKKEIWFNGKLKHKGNDEVIEDNERIS
ncbi:hypothetical protein V6N13_013996 [Hibiscus sabdariffa]